MNWKFWQWEKIQRESANKKTLNDPNFLLMVSPPFPHPNSDEISSVGDAYQQVSVVFACINRISTAVASVPLLLHRDGSVVSDDQKFLAWVQEPFPGIDYFRWVCKIVGLTLLKGGCRLVQVDPAIPLYLLPVDLDSCSPVDSKLIPVREYKYQGETIPAERVIDILLPDPLQYLDSTAPLEATRHEWQTAYSALRQANSMMRHGAFIPQAIISKNVSPTKEIFQQKLELLQEMLEKPSRSGKALYLEGDIDIKRLGFSILDLAVLDILGKTKERIAMAFGVPPALLADDASRYANYREQVGIFFEWTLRPLWRQIESALNMRFVKKNFGDDARVKFDEEKCWIASYLWEVGVGAMTDAVRAGILLPNEARQRLGLPPVKYGDSWWTNITLMPISAGLLDNSEGEERSVAVPQGKSLFHVPAVRQLLWRSFDRTLESLERKYASEIVKWLKEIRADAVRSVRESGGQAVQYDRAGAVARGTKIRLSLLMASYARGVEMGQDELVSTMQQGSRSLKSVKQKFDFTQDVIQRLRERAKHWAQITEDDTWNELQKVFVDAVREGLTIQAIIDRITEDPFFSAARAERIARTEVIGSLNEGKLDGYIESGVEKKEWLATQDDRVRDAHLEADGQIVNIDEPFVVGGEQLQYPGDYAGSPGNIINCRCTVLPVVEEEGGE